MSLVDHLAELRNRLLIAVAAVVLTTILGFFRYTHGVFGMNSLGEWLRGPYCSLPESARATIAPRRAVPATGHRAVRPVHVATQGRVDCRHRAGPARSGCINSGRSSPSGLTSRERRFDMAFVGVGAVLFIGGAVLAYVVLSTALSFLLTVGSDVQVTARLGRSLLPASPDQPAAGVRISFEFPLLVNMSQRDRRAAATRNSRNGAAA